jgi:hypothetical protein
MTTATRAIRLSPGIVIVATMQVGGCASVAPLNDAERAELLAPSSAIANRVAQLSPKAVAFVESSDQQIQTQGRALTTDELQLARTVGVTQPERVRILIADAFIAPQDPQFAIQARELGLGDRAEGGRTTGHGIQIKPQYASARWILAHELTHVGQYERLGTQEFVREYLTELLLVRYVRAPLEAAAHANEPIGNSLSTK